MCLNQCFDLHLKAFHMSKNAKIECSALQQNFWDKIVSKVGVPTWMASSSSFSLHQISDLFRSQFRHSLEDMYQNCLSYFSSNSNEEKCFFLKKHIQSAFTPQTSKRNRLLIGKPLDTLNLGPYIQCQRVFYGGWQHNYHCQQQARPMSSLFLFMSVSYHLRT